MMRPESVPLGAGLHPICSHDGRVTSQAASGNIKTELCRPYEALGGPAGPQGGGAGGGGAGGAVAPPLERFKQNLALLRLKDAWDAALQLDGRAYWLALSGKSMEVIDIQMAIRVYRQVLSR